MNFDCSENKKPSFLITLNISQKNIEELKRLAHFKNLNELDLSGNDLRDQPAGLKDLKFLKKLNLSVNNVSEIWDMPRNLEVCILSSNKVTSLNSHLTELSKLITLDLSFNRLSSVAGLEKIRSLKILLLKGNNINSISNLCEMPNLTELDCESNNLRNLSDLQKIDQMDSLNVINIKSNPILKLINNENVKFQNLSYFSSGVLSRSKKIHKLSLLYLTGKATNSQNFSIIMNKSIGKKYPKALSLSLSDESNFPSSEEEDEYEWTQKIDRANELDEQRSTSAKRQVEQLKEAVKNSEPIGNSDKGNLAKELPKERVMSLKQEEEDDFFPIGLENTSVNSNKRPVIKLDLSSIIKPGPNFSNLNTEENSRGVTLSSNHGDKSTKKIPLSATSSQNLNSNSRMATRINSCAQSSAHNSACGPAISNCSSSNNSIRNCLKSSMLLGVRSGGLAYKPEVNDECDVQNSEYIQNMLAELSKLTEENEKLRQKNKSLEEKINLKESPIEEAPDSFCNKELIEQMQKKNENLQRQVQELLGERLLFSEAYKNMHHFLRINLDENLDYKELDFHGLANCLAENFEQKIHFSMKDKILKNFDQLRDHYQNKERALLDKINEIQGSKHEKETDEILRLRKSNSVYKQKIEEISGRLKETEKKHHLLLAKHQNFIQKFVIMDRKKAEESIDKYHQSIPENFFMKLKNQSLKKKLDEIGNVTTNFSKDFGRSRDDISKSFQKEQVNMISPQSSLKLKTHKRAHSLKSPSSQLSSSYAVHSVEDNHTIFESSKNSTVHSKDYKQEDHLALSLKDDRIKNTKMNICLMMLKNKMKVVDINALKKSQKAKHSKTISEDFKKKENFLRFLNSDFNLK